MKKIGLFYSLNTVKSSKAGEKIKDAFGDSDIDVLNAEEVTGDQFMAYDNLILSTPTWFDGELPNYWDEFLPELEELDLSGKKFALYGLGDQKKYPENFVDAIGVMAGILEKGGAQIVGLTTREGYEYESSRAERGEHFLGLALDQENQAGMSQDRINAWVEQLRNEFS